jgi:hypothetical protein
LRKLAFSAKALLALLLTSRFDLPPKKREKKEKKVPGGGSLGWTP